MLLKIGRKKNTVSVEIPGNAFVRWPSRVKAQCTLGGGGVGDEVRGQNPEWS